MKSFNDPHNDPLVGAVEQTLISYRMVQPGDRVLVGFSGGPDSTATLLCLHLLAPKHAFALGAAHLNHALRGKRADADARHAAAAAAALGIPCFVETHSVEAFRQAHRMGLEEAAREVRYRFLKRTAFSKGYTHIALGHHRDDEAESVLMRLLRGSGPLGLAGIPPLRPVSNGTLTLIRPLIRMPRSAIMAFLQRHQVASVQDESNTDTHPLRNRIRHHLLPLLTRDYNPSLAEGLSRLARLLRDEEDWLGEITRESLRSLTIADHGTLLVLDRRRLTACPPALQRRVLRAAVASCKGDLRRVGFAPLEAARELAVQDRRQGACDLPGGLVVRVCDHRLAVQHLPSRRTSGRRSGYAPPPSGFAYQIPATGRFPIHETGVTMTFSLSASGPETPVHQTGHKTAFFDMDQLRFPLLVRNFQPGDRITPLGLNGTQKVKKVFIDRKVPREDRARYPLLVCDDLILWIVGVRQSEIAKIKSHTRRWLKVEVTGCLDQDDGYFKSI
jgi:tRNA(Ile)-lysidine synthase